MRRLLLHWFLIAVALAVTAKVVPGVRVDSLSTLAIAAVVVGLMNALVRPILAFFSLPLTILTLGLFYLIVNGVSFGLAARLVDGFTVNGLAPAVLGALCTSVVSSVLGWFAGADDDEDDDRPKRRKQRRD